jgi:hypothetical protein
MIQMNAESPRAKEKNSFLFMAYSESTAKPTLPVEARASAARSARPRCDVVV